jgi:hypothetical protein
MVLDLQRNALGKTVEKAADTQGKENTLHGKPDSQTRMVTVNPETGAEE